jgi:hypothetical protein
VRVSTVFRFYRRAKHLPHPEKPPTQLLPDEGQLFEQFQDVSSFQARLAALVSAFLPLP